MKTENRQSVAYLEINDDGYQLIYHNP
uniref:DUF1902 domain-containing protein n=1 Tax=Heterorhabditis bacteriophora TaxID=37862 RepID=A0A1I7X6X1_HETBA